MVPSDVIGERTVGAELLFDDEAQRERHAPTGEPTRDDGPMFHGRVVAYDPPQVFSFTWGGELLRFELRPEGDGTLLVFTQVLSHPSVAARNGAGLARLPRRAARGARRAATTPTSPTGAACTTGTSTEIGPPLGRPDGDGAVTWEGSTHVDAERVRAATGDPDAMAAWGGRERAGDPLRWDVEPTEHGTVFRLTHEAIGSDAELAATWHALLIQLDMQLAVRGARARRPEDVGRRLPRHPLSRRAPASVSARCRRWAGASRRRRSGEWPTRGRRPARRGSSSRLSRPSIVRSSRRANWAPRQKWAPDAEGQQLVGVGAARRRSVIGSANDVLVAVGRRVESSTRPPSGMSTPPIVVGSVA